MGRASFHSEKVGTEMESYKVTAKHSDSKCIVEFVLVAEGKTQANLCANYDCRQKNAEMLTIERIQ